MRLAHYLAQAGIASRRQAEKLILAGKVKVNGTRITKLGTKVTPGIDKVEYNGELLESESKIYILLNKPPGYISSVTDSRGRKTVLDLIPGIDKRIYPVGRLDFDTEGLLLLTNDGYFTNLMIHPRYQIEKKYQAWIKGKLARRNLEKLQKGIMLEDGITAPAKVKVLKIQGDNSLIEMVIHEGRKRQIKRMCSAVGNPVLSLKRTAYAFLTVQGVPLGKFRYLHPEEVKKLKLLATGTSN